MIINFKILHQGDVEMSHSFGYMAVGNENCVCFFIDPVGRAYIESSSSDENNCPTIYLATDSAERSTELVFPDHSGWRFHAGGAGKSIAVALVRRGSESA
jgi:hypothetical protein